MLEKLEKLEDGKVLYDGDVKELYDKVEAYMKMCYIYNDSDEDKYYFKYKNNCYVIVRAYAPEDFYYLKRTSEVETIDCIDLDDILKGIISDERIKERKEKLDRINEELTLLKEQMGSKSLKKSLKI